jgi:hypothetical protein
MRSSVIAALCVLLGATLVADAAPIFEFAKFFHGKWLLEIRTDTPGATKSADVQLANYHMRMQVLPQPVCALEGNCAPPTVH